MEKPYFHCVPNAFDLQPAVSLEKKNNEEIQNEIETNNSFQSNLFIKDCCKAFTCRSLSKKGEGGRQYSSGSTFFIKANSEPRCLLESIAQSIFKYHTSDNSSNIQGVPEFDPDISGAEWWTQVIDHRDEIGMHWDRDYGLESDVGVHQYPYKGSVSYFSNIGSPTIVVVKGKGTDMVSDDLVDTKLDPPYVLSYPRCGKHISFDGTCLHGAPVDLILQDEDKSDDSESENEVCTSNLTSAENSKKRKKNSSSSQDKAKKPKNVINRVTFLVNIWINHIPISSVPYPENKIKYLQPVSNGSAVIKNNLTDITVNNNKSMETVTTNYPNMETIQLTSNKTDTINTYNNTIIDEYRISNWSFVSNQNDLLMKIPLPPVDKLIPYCHIGNNIHNICIDYKSDTSLCALSVIECDRGDSDVEDVEV